MAKSLAVILGALVLSCCTARAQDRVRHDSLFAGSLSRTMHVDILIPTAYTPEKAYPLVFLLHGLGGNHGDWLEYTSLASDPEADSLIIAMPQADNSWYVNSMTERGERYEDYIVGDCELFVRSRYAVDTTAEAVVGLSMGGYGALVLGLRHSGRFRFIGAMSGSLDVPEHIEEMEKRGRGNLLPSLRRAFGDGQGSSWDEEDPFKLLGRVGLDSVPYVYLVTGIGETFTQRLILYRAFADSLRAHQVPYEYHETQGGHDFRFWGREIRPLLKRLRELLKRKH